MVASWRDALMVVVSFLTVATIVVVVGMMILDVILGADDEEQD